MDHNVPPPQTVKFDKTFTTAEVDSVSEDMRFFLKRLSGVPTPEEMNTSLCPVIKTLGERLQLAEHDVRRMSRMSSIASTRLSDQDDRLLLDSHRTSIQSAFDAARLLALKMYREPRGRKTRHYQPDPETAQMASQTSDTLPGVLAALAARLCSTRLDTAWLHAAAESEVFEKAKEWEKSMETSQEAVNIAFAAVEDKVKTEA
jgi:hypothetical protein